MAEKVLSNIVEGIMNSLDGPLAAIVELENLRDTVSAIKPVLLRAEEQLAPNHEVDRWLGELNDVIYDADDLLDAASTEALRHGLMTQDGRAKKVRTFLFKTNQFALGRKMGSKIKEIGEKLDAIKAGIETFQFAERPVRPRNTVLERGNDPLQYTRIMERENDKETIIERLMDSKVEGNVSFLPIVGRGGLGKTTLAHLIYNDEGITRFFDLKMWLSVGDTFDIKIIVKKLLESASRKIGEISKLDELIEEFQNAIVGRKYFLVLDNVWNEDSEKWSELQNLLRDGARGSRILITTRSENVAKLMYPSEPHYLRGLSDKASWDLFVDLTLAVRERLENSSILEMVRKIVQQCVGIPLITKMVASRFLYFENSEAGWCDSMEKLLEFSQDEYDVLPIPQLCYNMLPSHLKYCFTYCSLFPKGYTIGKIILIKLWIAQGFVKSQENLCLEDVGHEYFMDLLRGQFFHEPNFNEFGNIISCKMHDLMHDLATSMAGPLITMPEKRRINEKTRHVGFINFPPSMPSMLYRVRSIRTFLCSNFSNFEGECDCETIFSSFKLLRVLDLNYRDLTHVPSSISELKHLRYLDLSNNKEIVKLPKSITSLLNLQTIRLSGCWSLKKLPRDIKRLFNLRHLELDDCWELRYMPCGLEQLTNLQTLTLFVVNSGSLSKHCAGLNELNGLNNLRGKLVVRDSHAKGVVSKYQAANLMEKPHLTSLYLRWSTRSDVNNWDDGKLLEFFQRHPNLEQLLIKEYWGLRLSSWLSSLTSLVKLELFRCKECKCLWLLSQLSSLKYLWLEEMDAIQYISECVVGNELSSSSSTPVRIFPALETIHLSNCPELKGWWRDSLMEVSGGCQSSEHHLLPFFPRLSSLHIGKCPRLISMPMYPYLEELYLEDTSWKPLLQTMMTEKLNSFLSAASSFAPLSKIRTMTLVSITEVETLPEEWLQKFTCLWSLTIKHCDKLKSLTMEHCVELKCMLIEHCDKLKSLTIKHSHKLKSLTIQHLTALEKLELSDCYMLKIPIAIQWQDLQRLIYLEFSKLPKLKFLPSGLQHVTTLQRLKVRDCENLAVIPEWIGNCNSLKMLEIVRCPKLTSLPEGMHRLAYLRTLHIEKCPTLMERCKKEKGEDWPKIKHIPIRTIIE